MNNRLLRLAQRTADLRTAAILVVSAACLVTTGCTTTQDVSGQYAEYLGPTHFAARVHMFQDMSGSMSAGLCSVFADAREGTEAKGRWSYFGSHAAGDHVSVTSLWIKHGFLEKPTLRANVEIPDQIGTGCSWGPAELLESTKNIEVK